MSLEITCWVKSWSIYSSGARRHGISFKHTGTESIEHIQEKMKQAKMPVGRAIDCKLVSYPLNHEYFIIAYNQSIQYLCERDKEFARRIIHLADDPHDSGSIGGFYGADCVRDWILEGKVQHWPRLE